MRKGPQTRLQLLEPWSELVEDHVVFLRGDVAVALEQIGIPRIHFAFLDAEHTYDAVRRELAFVAAHQQEGDVIVCDDYTPGEFPEIVRAVDELAATGTYALEAFASSDDRGYAYLESRVWLKPDPSAFVVRHDDLGVVRGVDLPEREDRETVRTRLERPENGTVDANRVPLADVTRLSVEVDLPGSLDDDVDLLRLLLVPVRER